MMSVLRICIIICCVPHAFAIFGDILVESETDEDAALANIIGTYISKFRHVDRRLISIIRSSSTIKQTYKQLDLIESLVRRSGNSYFSYTFLDLSAGLVRMGKNYRGLTIYIVDDWTIFR